ncbi:MAG: CHASE domain-containing protein [Myxococcales bacterium]|nr:CHASE domain-containing protein [Myxococcales bacterium]
MKILKRVRLIGATELLIFALGLAVSVGVFLAMRNGERKRADLAFNGESTERSAQVDRRVADLLYSLKSIQHGQQTMGELSREGFSKLGRASLDSATELEELAYVPIVTPEERANFERSARRDGLEEFRIHDSKGQTITRGTTHPLLFIEPTPKASRFGEDLASNPAFLKAAKTATASGEATALPSVAVTDESGTHTRGTLLAPIYDPDGATFVRVGRMYSIKGHVVARFDVSQLLADALPEQPSDVVLQVVTGDDQRWLAGAPELAPEQPVFSRELNYPGETWVLRSTPTPAYFAARQTKLPYVGALVAFLVTLLLAFLYRQQRMQKAKVEIEVELRTHELKQRARDMRRVLDNVDSGLLTIDYEGRMSPEASQIVEHWFGPRGDDDSAIAYLSRFDETTAGFLEMGLEQLREDILPLELNIAQLPSQFSDGKQILHVSYLPFEDDDGHKLLLVMSDVTQRIGAEHQQKRQLEVISIFEHIAKDREGFVEFFNDGSRLVTAIVEGRIEDRIVLAREIHTLKGNCGMVGLKSVAELCHQIETHYADSDQPPTELYESLQARWREVTRDLHQFIGGNDSAGVWLSEQELQRVKEAVRRRQPPEALCAMLDDFRNARLETEFQRLAQRAKQLAKQQGKGNIGVEIEHNEVRLPHAPFKRFWANLVHVIRNAVDHGLESADEASERPRLRFAASAYSNEVVVEVADNGRGIDWGRLRSKAEKQGVSVKQDEDLLFLDGLSSKDEVSAISGRGVGMAAVKSAVEELGGGVEVETELGKGTTFRFHFPTQARPRDSRLPPRAA